MTTWTTLTDDTLKQDKPWPQSVARAVRDNPVAIAEGAAGAPRVLTKAINSQYFFAQQTSDYTINMIGDVKKMHFATETYDPDNLFDNAANHRFTPSVAGVYLVSAACYVNTATFASTFYRIDVKKNGGAGSIASNIVGASAGANGVLSGASIQVPVQMNGTTDYLEIWVWDSTGNTTGNGHRGYFSAIGLCEA